MARNRGNVMTVDKQLLDRWKPALENFFGDQLAGISVEKQKVLTSIAAKVYDSNAESFIANESASFAFLSGDNSQMARDVSNPTHGAHNGVTAQSGNAGSADPQFLLGLSLSLAAKTIGLELVQHIPATSQNVTIDYMTTIYNGGEVGNAANDLTFVVTAVFAKKPTLDKTKTYGFRKDNQIVLASFVKTARENVNGLIFELENKIEGTITGEDITGITYLADNNLGADLADSVLVAVDIDTGKVVEVKDADDGSLVLSSIDNTKAVENYVPHQTTKGLKRKLSRREADKGTDRGIAIDVRNENFVIGNSVFTGHIGRLQYKRLSEQGKSPLTFLSSSMLNEFAQEVNYDIITAARALGVSNALSFRDRGTSFDMYFGPESVDSKAFDAMLGANELIDKDGNSVAGKFGTIRNIRKQMTYENITSVGTAIVMLIKQACYAIGNDSRYGDGDAVVLGSNLAGYISASSMFTPLQATGSVAMDARTGAKLSGTIGDIKVYVDSMIPEASPIVTVLRTNKDVAIDIPGFEENTLLAPGLAYLAKDLVSSIELVPEGTGGRKIIMDSETDIVTIGDNPEKAYLTFAIDIDIPGLAMATN